MRAALRKLAMERSKGVLEACRDSLQCIPDTRWWPESCAECISFSSQVNIWGETTSVSPRLCISSWYGLVVLCSTLTKPTVIFVPSLAASTDISSLHMCSFLNHVHTSSSFHPAFPSSKSLCNEAAKSSRPILPAFPRETLPKVFREGISLTEKSLVCGVEGHRSVGDMGSCCTLF